MPGCHTEENGSSDIFDSANSVPLALNKAQDQMEDHDGSGQPLVESHDTNAPGETGGIEQDDAHQPVIISPEVINPDYKALLNQDNELIVSGRSVDELLGLIGEPPMMLRQGHRGSGWHKEIWVLPIYLKDSTGLYIYIKNGRVADWRLDTFVGIRSHPQLLEWF